MELAARAKGDAFSRMAYFDCNTVNRQYEYFSIDTRAPEMMNERSYEDEPHGNTDDHGSLSLWEASSLHQKGGHERCVSISHLGWSGVA
jgi:hypothetical protein